MLADALQNASRALTNEADSQTLHALSRTDFAARAVQLGGQDKGGLFLVLGIGFSLFKCQKNTGKELSHYKITFISSHLQE